MLRQQLKNFIAATILPKVQTPAQYTGGERNAVVKDHRTLRGRLCLAFPDTYTIGMSHHGLQVLYSLMNGRDDWCCERSFTPWPDMEEALRRHGAPLYSLETTTPLGEFDILGFSLQYEICYTNLLTMLDLAGIPLHAADRGLGDPLVIAGGPCAQNPEPLAPFVDLFVTGDGEPSLPIVCDQWVLLREAQGYVRPPVALDESYSAGGDGAAASPVWSSRTAAAIDRGEGARRAREEVLAVMAARIPFAYVPRFYEPEFLPDGRMVTLNRTRPDVPETIEPSVIADLDAIPLPTSPVVPYVECVHDRIALEIMRGCPWQCRFCQSTVIKRPLRIRQVETIVEAALESYYNTGFNEISLLSLSTSDYPQFEPLVRRMQEVFGPLDVSISIPSLRVNEALVAVAELMRDERNKSLTLAPEVARDDMRDQIRKKISNQDLFDGCRAAFQNGIRQVKLYFMCGLPGEREVDLDGIIDMAETISRIGKEVTGRMAPVTASVSNFVPKAHTPYQWNAMQTREYFHWAHRYLWKRRTLKSVNVKCHPIETSLLEGVVSRGSRHVAAAIELAWRRGARLDSWSERLDPALWWTAIADAGIDAADVLHRPYALGDRLPWDHLNVKKGRSYLEKEQQRATLQLASMAEAR